MGAGVLIPEGEDTRTCTEFQSGEDLGKIAELRLIEEKF
jgi:hypothetical protein